MKGSKVIPRKTNRVKPKKSPYREYLKNTNLPKPKTFMLLIYYFMSAIVLLAIILKLRHYFLTHK